MIKNIEQKNKRDEFLKLKVDRIFKTICLDEKENFDLLNSILSEILDTKVKVTKVYYPELPVSNKYEKVKIVDAIVGDDNQFYNIEINTGVDKVTRLRNFAYLVSFLYQRVYRGGEYNPNINFIQINLSWNLGSKNDLVKVYHLSNDKNPQDLYVANLQIVEFNMDKIADGWYNKDKELIRRYLHVLLLGLDEKGLKSLESGDKLVEKYKKKIMDINRDVDFVWFSPEEEEKIIEKSQRNYYKSLGIKEGKKAGIKEEKMKLVKNMAKEKASLEFISKVSNLSIEEVKEILNN